MNVGFIGTGLMGLPMAQRVLEAGFPLTVYNRTPEKLEALQETKEGSANPPNLSIASSPESVIGDSNCIVLMLTNAQAIREMLLSEPSRKKLNGKTVIQMGTIAPSESRAIQDAVVAAGGDYLEAPVLGSIPEAKAGKLIVMVGSSPEHFEKWMTVLKCFGPEPMLIGPVGSAAAVKLALNQLIGSLTSAFATSLGFVMRQGADVDLFMQILRESALYAPTFDKKLQRMVDRNYSNPNFPTKHLMKDMNLFVQEADSLKVSTSLVSAVSTILGRALELGLGDEDYSALFSAVVPEE